MDDFQAARSGPTPPLPWPTLTAVLTPRCESGEVTLRPLCDGHLGRLLETLLPLGVVTCSCLLLSSLLTFAPMIPLIRSGAIMPFVFWMQAHGRPVEARLREVDLAYVLGEAPDLPIPLMSAIAFVRAGTRSEGADFPCRVMARTSVRAIGPAAEVALNAPTVRHAFMRVAAFMPFHATHEIITAMPVPGGIVLREAWAMRMDDETRHMIQQYVAAILQAICMNAGGQLPILGRVAMAPHPSHGLSHLQDAFGQQVEMSSDRCLELFVPDGVADRPLRAPDSDRPESSKLLAMAPLRGDGTLSASAQAVIAGMLKDGKPTLERLSVAAGLSIRTLQRRLHQEGQSFSDLLEEVRCRLALEDLSAGDQSIGQIAGILGYGQSSSLTRAVRRWTGAPPIAHIRRQ